VYISKSLLMAPKTPAKGKGPPKGKGSAKGSKLGKGAATSSARKPKAGPRPKTVQVKTKPGSQTANKAPKKKKRMYTDKELNLPTLNKITPAGVTKPKGKKKGKVFVDDKESMMTILALVNAEKEGQIESKMIKARQLEEIREARRKEAEVRHERKGEKFEELKKGLKRRGKKTKEVKEPEQPLTGKAKDEAKRVEDQKKSRKRVAFA
jgi:60S ribosomal subunit assembly/export protein LOC1